MRQLIHALSVEHADLRMALGILQAIGSQIGAGGPFPTQDCGAVLRYLRDFVVRVHFQKEGRTLLPAIAIFGQPRDAEAAGAVLRAHEHARDLLRALSLYWEPDCELTVVERQGFLTTSRALGRCLEHGMLIEERLLFPVVPKVPVDDRLGWLKRFAAVERGRRSAQEWRRELTELTGHWSPT